VECYSANIYFEIKTSIILTNEQTKITVKRLDAGNYTVHMK